MPTSNGIVGIRSGWQPLRQPAAALVVSRRSMLGRRNRRSSMRRTLPNGGGTIKRRRRLVSVPGRCSTKRIRLSRAGESQVTWRTISSRIRRKSFIDGPKGAGAGAGGGIEDDGGEEDIEVINLGTCDWNIPPRGWLLGGLFCRRKVSSIIAPGAGGKTSLRTAQLMSCATGRPLTGDHVFVRCRVLVLGFEDDIDEMKRLAMACRLHHRVTAEELNGYFYIASLGSKPWRLAEYDDNGRAVEGALRQRIARLIHKYKFDIVSLDPLVKTHNVDENSNKAMDVVASVLTGLAHEYDIAVDAPQHSNKAGAHGDTEDANRGRGASSTKDAFRLVYGLRHMSEEEAAQLGVPPRDRRLFIRMDSAKANIAPPSSDARWFRLVGVRLGNATALYPGGDEVATVEPWEPVGVWSLITNQKANEILDVLEAGLPNGQRYSSPPRRPSVPRGAWRRSVSLN